jgi:zinc-binding in reverse transcriptase
VCNFRREVQEIILQEQIDDLIQWNRHSQGFSVKSVYTFLKSAPFIKTQIVNIWKLPVAPRIIVFMWLVLRNSILTLDNLKKRGWQMPNRCCLCFQEEESVNHIFKGCKLTTEIRKYVCKVWQLRGQHPPSKYERGDFQMAIDQSISAQWRSLVIITCFIIWRERCNQIFQNEQKNGLVLVREILEECKSYA